MNRLRKPASIAVLFLALLIVPVAFAAQTQLWFDFDNCSMCQKMTAEKSLMENMEWENHLTADGMMTVTVVNPGFEEAFARAMKNMEAVGGQLMAGEKLYICGFCTSYGALHMAGASFENFETAVGHINLVTSRDPVVIEKIHAHGQRTIDEMAKMTGGQEHGDHGHGSHDHESHDH